MRYGSKALLGGATFPASAYTYPSNWRGPSGFLESIGCLVRIWQDFNGAGDRVFDQAIFYPDSFDLASYNYLMIGGPSLTLASITPQKSTSVAAIAGQLVSVNGSRVVTRTAGSFIADGALPGMILSMASATNLSFGSVILSVDSATQVTLDRPAVASASGFNGTISKVPAVCHFSRVLWGGTSPYPLRWPTDGVQMGLHTTAAGAADTTGMMAELWPIFDLDEYRELPEKFTRIG